MSCLCNVAYVPCGQCFFFGRNIGSLTPIFYYFYYLNDYFLDQSIQKIFNYNLKTEALLVGMVYMPYYYPKTRFLLL